ncbi:MAG TPA: hypothetical protein PLW93_05980 [Candidatus Absconditabacterales bacterium]|nr:hypothetical protein [Candidatus Absconditabacterales bacterium]
MSLFYRTTNVGVGLLLWCISYLPSYAVTVEVPGDNITTRDTSIPSSTIQGDSEDIINLIKLINEYLWFSIASVCLAVAIYAGYQIIMSGGDKAKMQKGNDTLVGALIGIFISLFSYVLMRLVVNLF